MGSNLGKKNRLSRSKRHDLHTGKSSEVIGRFTLPARMGCMRISAMVKEEMQI